MIRAFASMFLNEPHRTSRNYKSIRNKIGKDIFSKDQRMEPYYAAALALYLLEFAFRNKRLDGKYKAARFHILLAIRILSAGYEMPAFTANKMEAYSTKIISVLQDSTQAELLIFRAAKIVDQAADGNYGRDSIRTEKFTETIVALSKQDASEAAV